MTKSFKEIGEKKEALIEQGQEAEQQIQSCMNRVAWSKSMVSQAQVHLDEVSQLDEEGNPVGDVEVALAQLRIAEKQLALNQCALNSARDALERISKQKSEHVQEIERHNQVEKMNLEKLRKLRAQAFGADSELFAEGIAQRLNEAEDAKVELLRSMGIDATPDYVSIGGEGGSDFGWQGGNFAMLDIIGQESSYRGGSSAQESSSIGLAAPVGGALAATKDSPAAPIYSEDAFMKSNRQNTDIMDVQAQRDAVKTRKLSDQQRYQMGLDYIDNMMEIYRDNLRDRDISDGEAMERQISILRVEYLKVLMEDIQTGSILLYNKPLPDFDILADQVRKDYAQYPPKYVITDKQREKIRKGIREGNITEKDIRAIGESVSEKYDRLVLEKHREYDEVRKEQFALALEKKNAVTKEEKRKIELRRRILMEKENELLKKYCSADMMKSILIQYRDIGPQTHTGEQAYLSSKLSLGYDRVTAAINNVRQYIPTDWIQSSNRKAIIAKQVRRGYFMQGKERDIVALSGNKSHMESCAFHEMGHRLESLYPEILEIEKQFYERRTEGEQLEWLGLGYSKKEVSRFDHFLNPYMGKDYKGMGYELLSMGLEGMFCEKYNIMRDPEYENLILGILVSI